MDQTTTEQPVTETPRPQRRPRAARTAANAVRHGILANIPVIPREERGAEWQAHLQGILASLQPVGHIEQVLAERIAFQLWRLVRVARFERDTFVLGYEVDVEYPEGEVIQSPLPGQAIAACDILERLQRYEAHLSREPYRAFRELRTLQALRRNAPAERPAEIRAELDQLRAPTAEPSADASNLSPSPNDHTQNCETNGPETQAQPVPTDEPTPSLGRIGQGVGRSYSEQQTAAFIGNTPSSAGPTSSAKNYETSHAQTGKAATKPHHDRHSSQAEAPCLTPSWRQFGANFRSVAGVRPAPSEPIAWWRDSSRWLACRGVFGTAHAGAIFSAS